MCLTTYQAHDCEHVVHVHTEKCPGAVADKKPICDRVAKEILASVGPSGFNCRVCYPATSRVELEKVLIPGGSWLIQNGALVEGKV